MAVLVSDNSGPGASRNAVARICATHDVPMIAPGGDHRMVEHWEWALNEAVIRFDPTHVTFLTDRMIYRPHAHEHLLRAVRSFPGKIICFNHDHVDDSRPRIRIHIAHSTFRAFRTDPEAVLSLAAWGQPWQWVLPRMLNSVVPVEVIHRLRRENGRVFRRDSA